jgi:hypothetical protein
MSPPPPEAKRARHAATTAATSTSAPPAPPDFTHCLIYNVSLSDMYVAVKPIAGEVSSASEAGAHTRPHFSST